MYCPGGVDEYSDPIVECSSVFCDTCAWDSDQPRCFECDDCSGIRCGACQSQLNLVAEDGDDFACPNCSHVQSDSDGSSGSG